MNKYYIMSAISGIAVCTVLFGAPVIGTIRLSIHSLHLVLVVPIECVFPDYNQPKYCPK